jgi:hypothetical protein
MDLITEQVKEEYGNIFDDKDEVLKWTVLNM